MFEQNGLEAMLACFVRFRTGTILILRGRCARGCRRHGFAHCWFCAVAVRRWPKMLEPTGNVQARRLILALSSVRARCFFSLLPDLFCESAT